jgi:hypothetical protein
MVQHAEAGRPAAVSRKRGARLRIGGGRARVSSRWRATTGSDRDERQLTIEDSTVRRGIDGFKKPTSDRTVKKLTLGHVRVCYSGGGGGGGCFDDAMEFRCRCLCATDESRYITNEV